MKFGTSCVRLPEPALENATKRPFSLITISLSPAAWNGCTATSTRVSTPVCRSYTQPEGLSAAYDHVPISRLVAVLLNAT